MTYIWSDDRVDPKLVKVVEEAFQEIKQNNLKILGI